MLLILKVQPSAKSILYSDRRVVCGCGWGNEDCVVAAAAAQDWNGEWTVIVSMVDNRLETVRRESPAP